MVLKPKWAHVLLSWSRSFVLRKGSVFTFSSVGKPSPQPAKRKKEKSWEFLWERRRELSLCLCVWKERERKQRKESREEEEEERRGERENRRKSWEESTITTTVRHSPPRRFQHRQRSIHHGYRSIKHHRGSRPCCSRSKRRRTWWEPEPPWATLHRRKQNLHRRSISTVVESKLKKNADLRWRRKKMNKLYEGEEADPSWSFEGKLKITYEGIRPDKWLLWIDLVSEKP